jgi:hypothetical protein
MFAMTLKAIEEPCFYLGMGRYYMRNGNEPVAPQDEWVRVELKKPLILDSRRAKRLIEKYRTRGGDEHKIRGGARRLSEDVMEMGHDGIIAIAGTAKDRQVTVVMLDRASITQLPGTTRLHAA